jgi:putative alpha-1,2-mannosidase
MNQFKNSCLLFLWLLLLLSQTSLAQSVKPESWINYVDPLIGTAPATTQSAKLHSEAQSELKGQTFPAVGVPFGMTHWTPRGKMHFAVLLQRP